MGGRAPLYILSTRSGVELSQRICRFLKVRFNRINVIDFSCGEFKTVLPESVRGKDVFLVSCALDNKRNISIESNVMETLMIIDTLKNCHANSITLVIPCLPYARQDKRYGREPSTALLLAKMIGCSGADAVITYDLHASQIKCYFEAVNILPDHLYATKIFLSYIKRNHVLNDVIVVPPDPGAVKRALLYSKMLFPNQNRAEVQSRVVFTAKKRSLKQPNKIDFIKLLGDVKGKTVMVVDDMVDTGGTVSAIIEAINKKGAEKTILCATHAILSGPAKYRLDDLYKHGKLDEFLTTDTVPQKEDYLKKRKWFKQLSIAKMTAEIIRRINNNEPTSSLYT